MEIKFKHSITDYKYLVMFDLASKITGVCVWDIQKHIPCYTTILNTSLENEELPVANLYNLLDRFFEKLYTEQQILATDILVYKEAMPVQLRGGSSTVQTFVALARSHAILDLYTFSHNIAIYDYVGVYPATTHAYYKKIQQLESKEKVTKELIKDYIEQKYNIQCKYCDESDAIFLALTFVENKWDKDLVEAQRLQKKHLKELVSEKAKSTVLEKIEYLEALKIHKGE